VSAADRPLLAAALAHGALAVALTLGPGGPLAILTLAVALCWSANTVSHIHLHTPLFPGRRANAVFSLYLTILLAIPQGHWRRRHLRHHQLGAPPASARDLAEPVVLIVALLALGVWAPARLLGLWAPATALGLVLCALQGRGEHLHPPGVDHHGRLYNRLWFNDGHHAAHHRHPDLHWTELPAHRRPDDVVSGWPPVLRWINELPAAANRVQAAALDALERVALGLPALQRLLLRTHEPALRALLPLAGPIRDVIIVGGGLYPRSALLLGRLLPGARLTLVDTSAAHLIRAAAHLPPHWTVRLRCAHFDAAAPMACDLLVIPLGFRGDRARLYREPPAPAVLVHDWLWRRRGSASARVSLALGKRLNLVVRSSRPAVSPGNLSSAARPEEPAPCHRQNVTGTLRGSPTPPAMSRACSSGSGRATTLPS
jgi:hypothetical protein